VVMVQAIPAPPVDHQQAYDKDSVVGRNHVCSVSGEELQCVLHFRHQRNLCKCPFKFEISHLLNPLISQGPSGGKREMDCEHCWGYATESFCTYHLAEMGAMQCYDTCAQQIGAVRPFHQEAALGRSFLTYVGAAAGNCDLKRAEVSQYRMLNQKEFPLPQVGANSQKSGDDYTSWNSHYSQKVHQANPGRDDLFAIRKTQASAEELAARASALWNIEAFEGSPKEVDAVGEAEQVSEENTVTAVKVAKAVPVHISQVADPARPIFKKFYDTYSAGGGGGDYSVVGGITEGEAQAVEKLEAPAYDSQY